MRTTIDIPDPLFRVIKATAATQGETLRAFLLRAAQQELKSGASCSPKTRVQFPLIKSKEKSYDLSPERVAELLDEEEHDAFTRH